MHDSEEDDNSYRYDELQELVEQAVEVFIKTLNKEELNKDK